MARGDNKGRGKIRGQVQGDKAIQRRLEKLKTAVRNKIVRKAVTKAVQPVTKRAKARVAVEFGLLKRSLGHKVKTYRRGEVTAGIIGPRVGMAQAIVLPSGAVERHDPVKYAHLGELGAAPHFQPNNPWYRGGILHPGARPRPFLRPAWDEGKRQAARTVLEETQRGIEQEAKKA